MSILTTLAQRAEFEQAKRAWEAANGQMPELTPREPPYGLPADDNGDTAPGCVERSVVLTREQRTDLWRQFDQRATNEEAAYKRTALLLFAEERANIARVMVRAQERNAPLATTLDGVRRQLRHTYKPGGEVVQRWTDRYHPLIGETFAKGGAHISHALTRSMQRGERLLRFNPYHDELGQFASGPGGGGGGTATAEHPAAHAAPAHESHETHAKARAAHAALSSAASSAAHSASAPDGGFTLHDDLSAESSKGYFVSMAGHEQQIPAKAFTGSALLKYRDSKVGLLRQDPSLRIGGWHNGEDGLVYLDLSKRFGDKNDAIAFGTKHGQIAGYDAYEGKSFHIGARSTLHRPLGLTLAQEEARLAAMHGNPIETPTLRTAPTLAELDALTGDVSAEPTTTTTETDRAERADPTKPPKKATNAPAVSPPLAQFDFHLTDPNVQQAIRDRSARLAEYVGETTGAAIDDALAIALREGMSIEETANLIDQVAFGLGAANRATTIARTETIGALNQGQFMAAADSGQIEGKEWLTQGDERVRETHTECEAQGMIAMDDTFDNGCAYPGDPDGDPEETINCRCSLLYYNSLDAGASTLDDL